MSASGFAGATAQRARYGAFEARVRLPDGTEVDCVIKILPPKRQGKDAGGFFAKEVEGARAAAATGLGPDFYGVVHVEDGYGFAMAKVPGAFVENFAKPGSPGYNQAEAEFQAARNALSDHTADDVRAYGKRLLDLGYYQDGEVQGLVGPDGHWRPIDFAGVKKLPPPGPDQANAIADHTSMIEAEARGLETELETVRLERGSASAAANRPATGSRPATTPGVAAPDEVTAQMPAAGHGSGDSGASGDVTRPMKAAGQPTSTGSVRQEDVTTLSDPTTQPLPATRLTTPGYAPALRPPAPPGGGGGGSGGPGGGPGGGGAGGAGPAYADVYHDRVAASQVAADHFQLNAPVRLLGRGEGSRVWHQEYGGSGPTPAGWYEPGGKLVLNSDLVPMPVRSADILQGPIRQGGPLPTSEPGTGGGPGPGGGTRRTQLGMGGNQRPPAPPDPTGATAPMPATGVTQQGVVVPRRVPAEPAGTFDPATRPTAPAPAAASTEQQPATQSAGTPTALGIGIPAKSPAPTALESAEAELSTARAARIAADERLTQAKAITRSASNDADAMLLSTAEADPRVEVAKARLVEKRAIRKVREARLAAAKHASDADRARLGREAQEAISDEGYAEVHLGEAQNQAVRDKRVAEGIAASRAQMAARAQQINVQRIDDPDEAGRLFIESQRAGRGGTHMGKAAYEDAWRYDHDQYTPAPAGGWRRSDGSIVVNYANPAVREAVERYARAPKAGSGGGGSSGSGGRRPSSADGIPVPVADPREAVPDYIEPESSRQPVTPRPTKPDPAAPTHVVPEKTGPVPVPRRQTGDAIPVPIADPHEAVPDYIEPESGRRPVGPQAPVPAPRRQTGDAIPVPIDAPESSGQVTPRPMPVDPAAPTHVVPEKTGPVPVPNAPSSGAAPAAKGAAPTKPAPEVSGIPSPETTAPDYEEMQVKEGGHLGTTTTVAGDKKRTSTRKVTGTPLGALKPNAPVVGYSREETTETQGAQTGDSGATKKATTSSTNVNLGLKSLDAGKEVSTTTAGGNKIGAGANMSVDFLRQPPRSRLPHLRESARPKHQPERGVQRSS